MILFLEFHPNMTSFKVQPFHGLVLLPSYKHIQSEVLAKGYPPVILRNYQMVGWHLSYIEFKKQVAKIHMQTWYQLFLKRKPGGWKKIE